MPECLFLVLAAFLRPLGAVVEAEVGSSRTLAEGFSRALESHPVVLRCPYVYMHTLPLSPAPSYIAGLTPNSQVVWIPTGCAPLFTPQSQAGARSGLDRALLLPRGRIRSPRPRVERPVTANLPQRLGTWRNPVRGD